MAQANYRQSDTWKAALDLAPKLVALAEDLPASEEMGLAYRLKKIMVELPAAAALDQLRGTDTRQRVALQLMAAIDMIDRVYPALDTADTRTAAETLADQLLEDMAFAPEVAPAAPVAPGDPHAHADHDHDHGHDHMHDHPPDPVSVPVMPDTEGTAITLTPPDRAMPPEHHSVSVAVQPDMEHSSGERGDAVQGRGE